MKFWRRSSTPRPEVQVVTAEEVESALQSLTPGERLRWAIANSDLETMTELLNQGADLEDSDENGTLLTFAAMNGKLKIVQLLLDRGANVHAADQAGNTTLHHVAWEGWKEVAHRLIDSGADLNARNAEGFTPLMIAQSASNSIIAAILKEAGAEE